MTSDSRTAYPAEYYYPEFLESRPDDPRKSPPTKTSLATVIDNEPILSRRSPVEIHQTNEIPPKNLIANSIGTGPQTLRTNISTNQGLPTSDITKSVKSDPKKNLIRDPTDRNIPRLIVDQDLIQKTVRTTATDGNQFDQNQKDPLDIGKKTKSTIDPRKSQLDGQINPDFASSSRKTLNPSINEKFQNPPSYFKEEKPPVDDFWKKELKINDGGVVSIEPLNYEQEVYDGPYGLTRQGALIYYIAIGILTVLAGIFLLLTGIFYARHFPDGNNDPAKIAGLAICGFIFYLGIILILVAIWHQKYRAENPRKPAKRSDLSSDSRTHLKTSMETEYNNFDPAYEQPPVHNPYQENYSMPYGPSTVNEQTLLQQPGAANGYAYYDPVVWPTQVDLEPQYDPKFSQPMDYAYGQPTTVNPGRSSQLNVSSDQIKPLKKKNHNEQTKPVQAAPSVNTFDNVFPDSTVTDTRVPNLRKAPETKELMKTIDEMERSHIKPIGRSTSNGRSSNRVNPSVNSQNETTKENRSHDKNHHRSRRRRQHRSHRRSSRSPCSTCSDYSYDDIHSDVTLSRYENSFNKTQTKPVRSQTISPTNRRTKRSRSKGINSDLVDRKGVTIGLEDVPNVRDDWSEQIPVVRRTIIVEPYPEAPTTEVIVKPNHFRGRTTIRDNNLEDIDEDNGQNRSNRSRIIRPKKK